jgi:hypothetical protein
VRTVSLILFLISLTGSVYYGVAGLTKPESMAVYRRANVPVWAVQASAVVLGAGGVLLLFPLTFRLGAVLLVMHSLFTIVCFSMVRNWKGGVAEALLLQVPVLLLGVGYPVFARDAIRALLGR